MWGATLFAYKGPACDPSTCGATMETAEKKSVGLCWAAHMGPSFKSIWDPSGPYMDIVQVPYCWIQPSCWFAPPFILPPGSASSCPSPGPCFV